MLLKPSSVLGTGRQKWWLTIWAIVFSTSFRYQDTKVPQSLSATVKPLFFLLETLYIPGDFRWKMDRRLLTAFSVLLISPKER